MRISERFSAGSRCQRAGFTLMEIMLVVVIIGMLMAAVFYLALSLVALIIHFGAFKRHVKATNYRWDLQG